MSPRAAWRLESLGFSKVFDYAPGKLDWLSAGLPAEGALAGLPNLGTVARGDVVTCQRSEQITGVQSRMPADGTGPCVVVNDHRIVLGLVRSDAIRADGSRTVEEVMLSGPVTFRPNVSLEEISHYMDDHGISQALVTTPDGELIGLASAGDVHRLLAQS